MNTIYFEALTPENIARAADIIRAGGLLGIPTETVYGLGANALDEKAVLHIFEAKGRPQDNPLIIHVPDASWLERYCESVPEAAYRLAERFWPGPLTMILPRKPIVPLRTTAGSRRSACAAPITPIRRRDPESRRSHRRALRKHLRAAKPHVHGGHARGHGRQNRRDFRRRALPRGRRINDHRPHLYPTASSSPGRAAAGNARGRFGRGRR